MSSSSSPSPSSSPPPPPPSSSSSSSSISFTTLRGFWISQQGHSKPPYSMPVLSNVYLDRIYFMKSLGFRHLWLIPVGPLQNEKNTVCCACTDPPYFPNGPTDCTSISEFGTSLKVLATDIKS